MRKYVTSKRVRVLVVILLSFCCVFINGIVNNVISIDEGDAIKIVKNELALKKLSIKDLTIKARFNKEYNTWIVDAAKFEPKNIYDPLINSPHITHLVFLIDNSNGKIKSFDKFFTELD